MAQHTRAPRIGICGGTFNPVHLGHLLLTEQCREQLELARVLLIPAGLPPHKQGDDIAPGEQRAAMLELAVAGYRAFVVDRRELRRHGPSYTVDTLRELHAEQPEAELCLLLGADSLSDLPHWREPREIARLATLVVVNRGREPLPALAPLIAHLGAEAVERIQVVQIPGIDISSTDIRARVRAGRSIRYMTSRAVEEYIRTHRLYQSTEAT